MRPQLRLAVSVVVMAAACYPRPPEMTVFTESNVIVGGVARAGARTCGGIEWRTDQSCEAADDLEMTFQDPSVFEFVEPNRFKALKEGSTTLEFSSGVFHETQAVAAFDLDAVEFQWEGRMFHCAPDGGHPFMTGASLEHALRLQGDGRALNGEVDIVLVLSSPLAGVEWLPVSSLAFNAERRPLRITAGSNAGSGELSSSLSTAVHWPIRVYAPPEITQLRAGPTSPDPLHPAETTRDGNGIHSHSGFGTVALDAIVGTDVSCADTLERQVRTLTPDVCRPYALNGDGGVEQTFVGPDVRVEALKPGTCTLTATLEGTPHTVSASFPVRTLDGGMGDAGP